MEFLLYLLGLVLIAAWIRLGPRLGLRWLLLLLWTGLLLTRVAPPLFGNLVPAPKDSASIETLRTLVLLARWMGSVCLIRAIAGFTMWDRPRTNARTVLLALALAGVVLAGTHGRGILVAGAMLTIPWLFWVRWRRDLGVGGLIVASSTGVLTVLINALDFSQVTTTDPVNRLTGMAAFVLLTRQTSIFYALIATVPAAVRIHLSIRRIGRRLFASHLLAGVVPGGLAAVFLLLASALFLSTYRGMIGAQVLQDRSHAAERPLVRALQQPHAETAAPFGDEASAQTILVRFGDAPIRTIGRPPDFAPDSLLRSNVSSHKTPFLWDGTTLFLRTRVDTILNGEAVRAEALAPIDSMRMVRVSRILGVPVRVNPGIKVVRAGGGVSIGALNDSTRTRAIGPAERGSHALPGGTIVSCLVRRGGGWNESMVPIYSAAGLGEPIASLFSTAPENPLAIVVLFGLGLIALLFVGAIAITIAMVFGMGRSVTEAVGALTRATDALGEGRFEHRIDLAGKDELWDVAASFNRMAEGLGKMRAMELETQRLEEELRLARQIQGRLLPAAPPPLEQLELAGLSIPAREVGGDYFDYLLLEDGQVIVAVADVSGKGVGAALLMSSFRASLRSQDVGRIGLAEAAAQLNRFVCSSVDPGKFITAFLAVVRPATGEIRYVNAGHEPPMLMRSDGSFEELDRGGLIMGAFAQAEYEEGFAHMDPDALLTVFTDGVTEARNVAGEFFGSDALREILGTYRRTACPDLLRKIVEGIQRFSGEAPQSDDITLLLARRT